MNKTIAVLAAVLCSFQITSANAESIKLAGSGQMIPLINSLGKGYMKKNPQDTVDVNQKSLGQLGGVMAVNKGAIDIAMSARYLDKTWPVSSDPFLAVANIIRR